jgi:hypothetical protein
MRSSHTSSIQADYINLLLNSREQSREATFIQFVLYIWAVYLFVCSIGEPLMAGSEINDVMSRE